MNMNNNDSRAGVNLLASDTIRKLITWKGFPYVLQAFSLAAFIALLVVGWGLYAPKGVDDKLFAKSSLVTLVIWAVWWPAMVWVAVILGRVWCTVCPLELVSSAAERISQFFGVGQRRLGRLLRTGIVCLLAYLAIQMLVAGIHLHRVPAYTSVFLLVLLVGAAVSGLIFRDRAFCRGFCPLRMLLNTYGRGGVVAVRPASAKHPDQPAPMCPSLLNTRRLNDNSECLVCARCIKSPSGKEMQLLLRQPFSRMDTREREASWVLTVFAMMVSGFVFSEITGIGEFTAKVFTWVPEQVTSALGLASIGGWVSGAWMLIVFPIVLWTVMGIAAITTGTDSTIGQSWRRMALPAVMIVAGAHMAKAVEKSAAWIPYLSEVAKHPKGGAALAIANGTMAEPASLIGGTTLSLVALSILVLSIVISIREAGITNGGIRPKHALPYLVLGGLYILAVFGWGSL